MMMNGGRATPLRIGFYSHDTYGLGHLSRCVKVAEYLARGLDPVAGLFLTGSPHTVAFQVPADHRIVRLPPVTKRADGSYAGREAGASLDRVLAGRRSRIDTAVEDFSPDLFIVDNVPCGLGGEVLPVLRRLAARHGVHTVLALRDVLDRPEVILHEWQLMGAAEALEMYDEVWVFGSADDVGRMISEGPLAAVAHKVVACGPLGSLAVNGDRAEARSRVPTPRRPRPQVIVTGGGGKDAEVIIRSYLDLLRAFRPAVSSRIVLGPDFPEETLRELTSHNGFEASIHRFVPRLASEITGADVLVSMAGYNTVCEVRSAGRPAVLVPRVAPREEQWMRARALERSGHVKVEHPASVDAGSLWLAIEELLETPAPTPAVMTGGNEALVRAARLLGEEPRQLSLHEFPN